MLPNHWKTLFCLALAVGALQCQYIPFPNAVKMDREPPYLNPSVNDPLFFNGGDRRFGAGLDGADNNANRLNAIKFLGNNIFYDSIRKIYINVVTGDYYDPSTGLVYRRVAADKTGFVNGRVGPNPASSNKAPREQSDPVDLPRELRDKVFQQLGRNGQDDSDEDCDDCARKGQCYRCKKITPRRDCNSCWSGKAHSNCDHCYREKFIQNLPLQRMGELIVAALNRHRRAYDVKEVRLNQHLFEVAMVQNLYQVHRGYLSNDNFLANISTFRGGAMTTGFIQETRLGDAEGADKFLALWKKSPEQNENLIIPDLDQCGAAVFFDQKAGKFIATLVCVKL